MSIVIEPYREERIPAVREFNRRLVGAGVAEDLRFPEEPAPAWSDGLPRPKIRQEYFLALEGSLVRGGYIIKHQDFSFSGRLESIGYLHHPISEGIINKSYVGLIVQILRNSLKDQPLLFALGMGGTSQPLPKILKAMGWPMCTVPFQFRVVSPGNFMREIQPLRTTGLRRLAMNVARLTGTGWLVLKTLQGVAAASGSRPEEPDRVERVERFGRWADDLWDQCKTLYSMVAARDGETLNLLYPASADRFLRLRITRGEATVGWAVLLDTSMQGDRYFGNLRVGAIVDCLACPEDAASVIRAATAVLENRGVDLVVSNQSHFSWFTALKRAGFLPGPSNFLFAVSPALAKVLGPLEVQKTKVHLNRGDGDGPIHL